MKPGECKCGYKVKDRITGYTGIVTCVSVYLNDCERVQIQGEYLLEGKRAPTEHMDVQDIVLIDKGFHEDAKNNTGGDRDIEKSPFPITKNI